MLTSSFITFQEYFLEKRNELTPKICTENGAIEMSQLVMRRSPAPAAMATLRFAWPRRPRLGALEGLGRAEVPVAQNKLKKSFRH